MKFGKTLTRAQIPEWTWSYINYKALKKTVGNIVASQRKNESPQLIEDAITVLSHNSLIPEFFFAMDRELEKVSTFFLYKKTEMERRIRILSEKYQTLSSMPIVSTTPLIPTNTLTTLSSGEPAMEGALLASLIDTKEMLHKTLRFGELNTSGFHKILKKLAFYYSYLNGFDKKAHRQTQTSYLKKVLVLPFSNSSIFNDVLDSIELMIVGIKSRINQYQLFDSSAVPPTDKPKALIVGDDNLKLMSFLEKDDVDGMASFLISLGYLEKEDHLTASPVVMGVGIFNHAVEIDLLRGSNQVNPHFRRIVLVNTLFKSCKVNAFSCVKFLILKGADLTGTIDVDERSFLHKLVLSGGKISMIQNLSHNGSKSTRIESFSSPLSIAAHARSITLDSSDDADFLKELLLESASLRSCLLLTDVYGRIPLHYAALNGCVKISAILVEIQKKFYPDQNYGSQWIDHEGHSPFFYAVYRGFANVVEILLNIENIDVDNLSLGTFSDRPSKPPITPSTVVNTLGGYSPIVSASLPKTLPMTQTPLAVSCDYGHVHLTKLLIMYGANINSQNQNGESPLHIAASHGYDVCLSLLLNPEKFIQKELFKLMPIKADCNIKDNLLGWTPLFSAVVEGHLKCVEILLNSGASSDILDYDGWTPHEHAVFRGHFEIAKILRPLTTLKSIQMSTPINMTPTLSPITPEESKNILIEPDRSYGHNFLKDRTMVIVTLGSYDTRVKMNPLELYEDRIPAYPSLSLVVSSVNAVGEPSTVDLPARESFEPIIFYSESDNTHDFFLRFDLVPTFGSKKEILGRGNALFSSLELSSMQSKSGVGSKFTIPLMNSQMNVIGLVHFEYLIIKPFSHSKLSIGSKQTYWKFVETKVIGHRGAGANRSINGASNLQIGENTVLSFVTAASLGAEYVEFDVQITKDNVPVIYHDWILSETGLNIAVNDVMANEFKELGPRGQRPGGFKLEANLQKLKKSASFSDDDFTVDYRSSHAEKEIMISNFSYGDRQRKHHGGRGDMAIKAPFATLEELFLKVPKAIGFNIEVKYPTAMEIEANNLRAHDLNLMIDQILNCVYDNAGERSIIFSSFHPEACLMLNLKQPNYPVFFLTEAGVHKTLDIRCNSLQEAIRFAKFSDLLGIVSLSDPLIEAPHLCAAVKENGLLLFTYGAKNNDAKCAALQRQFGVDAIIVDFIEYSSGTPKKMNS